MIASILGSVVSYLAGSLLWRVALILGVIFLIVWLARRLRHGPNGKPAEGNAAGALILLIALAGATAGLGYGALDRAAESVRHTKERASIEAQNATLAADLDTAQRNAEALRANAEHARKLADAAATRAAASDKRVIAAQRERTAALKNLSRRVSDVSKNADGSVPVVGPDWVRDYNAALGFLPPLAADPWQSGGTTAAAGAAGAVPEPAPGHPGAQPDAPGLLAAEPVTTADVLATHITNADAARDSAERLTGLQDWYNALREERNAPTESTAEDPEP